jgi:hypothetical protein
VSERIDVAKLREQFTLWPQVLACSTGRGCARLDDHSLDDTENERVEALPARSAASTSRTHEDGAHEPLTATQEPRLLAWDTEFWGIRIAQTDHPDVDQWALENTST